MLVEYNLCYGCKACLNICPQNAIKMKDNKEGFLYPIINKDTCVNCNKCTKVCPALKNQYKPKRSCTNKGTAVRSDKYAPGSTSGGAFALMANNILSVGGYVAGAVFNDEWKVEHIISNKVDDLNRMRGSKYVQSDIMRTYDETKELLDKGKLVLFSGTPCQISGLYGFLGKYYENLITIDLICHGVNSPMIWDKYLDDVIKKDNIESIIFRNKAINISSQSIMDDKEYFTIKYKNKELFNEIFNENDFMNGFLNGLFLRPICSECQFSKRIRQGDITIGDFWADEAAKDRKFGISQVLLNSKKGKIFFETFDKYWDKKYIINLNKTKYCSPNINGNTFKHHPARNRFFEVIKFMSFKKALDYTLNNKFDIAIIGMHSFNFGNLVTTYSLYKFVSDMGKSVLIINRPLTSIDRPTLNCFNLFKKNPYP